MWSNACRSSEHKDLTVSGFSLPVAMIYVENAAESARVSGIAANRGAAQAFVQRLVMQTVFNVLESQARAAFLPDPVISTILGQLTVSVTYEPLKCQAVALKLEEMVEATAPMKISQRCIIAGNTVTGICTHVKEGNANVFKYNGACNDNFPCQLHVNFRNSYDHKHHHGKLAENYVAKCIEQSGSNVGSRSI
ncbi:hypothetical protein KIN20_014162 [Parelaphostrongylus tenuis]|uniref:Uncharacterized protein n=1 Tax=Parelaphostrongylus tenuis TaxID=148309 RepID=A0AAD5QP77_PARTN|nr:hypothetical protein KIN20_014162 [Parelaphostrongylus tenuis]